MRSVFEKCRVVFVGLLMALLLVACADSPMDPIADGVEQVATVSNQELDPYGNTWGCEQYGFNSDQYKCSTEYQANQLRDHWVNCGGNCTIRSERREGGFNGYYYIWIVNCSLD